MKQCPVCKNTYTDDSLAFCLSDGASLIPVSDLPTQRISFDKMKVEIPSGSSYPSDPTIISAPRSVPQKRGKGLLYSLLVVGALILAVIAGAVGLLFYSSGDFGKKQNVLSNSASPAPAASPAAKEDNTQELKDRLANVEKQLSEQRNAGSRPAVTPLSTPAPSNSTQGTVTAKVSPTSDGFLALRSAPSTEGGEQILKIPTGATVELEDCQRNYVTISGRRGRWCMISYGGETGWAFDAWLIR